MTNIIYGSHNFIKRKPKKLKFEHLNAYKKEQQHFSTYHFENINMSK